MRVNTTGALLLLKLAESSPGIQAFVQVSSCYVNADRTGYIEERFYESKNDWQADYDKIRTLSQMDLKKNKKDLLGQFPNAYVYTKRMAEHLLWAHNKKQIPLVFLRASTIGVAA